MSDEYIKIGDAIPDGYHKPFQLNVYDFVDKLTPPKSTDLKEIDPLRYFITSGDAVQKTNQLRKDLYAYAGTVRSMINGGNSTKILEKFEKECWRAAGKSTVLMNALVTARGSAVFLETEWVQHILTCTPKNPRIRGRK